MAAAVDIHRNPNEELRQATALAGRRQLSVPVPAGVKAGETQLEIDVGDGHLRVVVPALAVPGDELHLHRDSEGAPWRCSLQRPHDKREVAASSSSAASTGARSTASGSASSSSSSSPVQLQRQVKIQVLVPAEAVPGETKLEINTGGSETLLLPVPEGARPGDQLVITKAPSDGGLDSDEGEQGSWACTAIRERVARPHRECNVDELANLAPLKAPAMSNDDAYRELVAAVRDAGGFVSSKIVRGSRPPLNVPGLLATDTIMAGEEVCRIPRHLHLSPTATRAQRPTLWAAVVNGLNELPEKRRPEIAQVIFLASLMQEAEDRAVANAGEQQAEAPVDEELRSDPCWRVWGRYADSLLAEDFSWHPYRRAAIDPEGLQASLAPSLEGEYLTDMAGDIVATHRAICKNLSSEVLGPGGCSLKMFMRARLSILTRVFQTCDESTLVPVLDLFNHSHDQGLTWRWDPDADAMTLVADRMHEPGEELMDSYGPRSNHLLFRTYGFTQAPEVEPGFTYIVCPERVHSIYSMFLPQQQGGSQVMLDSKHVDDTLCKALNTASTSGNSASQFLKLICARCKSYYDEDATFGPLLEALRKVRAKDPTKCTWWSHLREEEQHLVDSDAVRIKMSEYLCLETHLEAVACYEGQMTEESCLREGAALRRTLAQAFKVLDSGGQFKLTYTEVASKTATSDCELAGAVA